jgi:hypothetical protein
MDYKSIANGDFAPQRLPLPQNYFRTFSDKRSKQSKQSPVLALASQAFSQPSNYFKTFSAKRSKQTKPKGVFAPQRLPPPQNYFKTFSVKRSKPTRVLAAQPLPPPSNYFKTFSAKKNDNDSSSFFKFLEKKKKCPEGSRKNRKTKLCEPITQILQRPKRKYTKGALQRCRKGTYRNKLTNNCEPKKLWTADVI